MTFPIWFNPSTWDTHIFPVFFGGTVVSADRTVVSAPSMQLVYFVAVDTQRQIEKYAFVCIYYVRFVQAYRTVSFYFIYYMCLCTYVLFFYHINRGNEWEEEFLRVAGKAEDSGMFKHIRVARFASRTLDHELERNTQTVVPYFALTFILMGSFR